jgi:DNA-binding response OmpR family regulator
MSPVCDDVSSTPGVVRRVVSGPLRSGTMAAVHTPAGQSRGRTATVVLYSQDAALRASVRTAVGRRPAADTPRIDWVECDRFADVIDQIDGDGADLLVLDGEAQPTGGMGLSRQLKMERADGPPVVVLLARAQDGWLASWAQTDATIARPVDPVAAREVVAAQLRGTVVASGAAPVSGASAASGAVPHVR